MATIKYTQDGSSTKKIILKNVDGQNKVSCECCGGQGFLWVYVGRYTETSANPDCGGYFLYYAISYQLPFGNQLSGLSCGAPSYGECDFDFYPGLQCAPGVDLGGMKADGIWTSSVNISVNAAWSSSPLANYEDCDPITDPVSFMIDYRGVTKTTQRVPETVVYLDGCPVGYPVIDITVYSTPLGDGSYFEIV
jgi:hypothetical protein